MTKSEKKRLKFSLIPPIFFLIIMWIVWIFDYSFNLHLYKYGIYPLNLKGFFGIFFAPFIHGDFNHIFSNTFPFLTLGTALFFFYKKYAFKVLLLLYFFSGFWVWLAARSSYHIGVSGIIYGLASFLVFSGLIHKNKALTAISFAIIFLYGSMVWGVLPLKPETSWEGHLFGAVTGFILTLGFANKTYSVKIEDKKIVETEISEFSEPTISNDNFSEISFYYKADDNK